MTGYNVDEQQCITVPSGWGWNDKAGSRWRAADFDAPPPKSKLLASHANTLSWIIRIGNRPAIRVMRSRKRGCEFDFELDWGKS